MTFDQGLLFVVGVVLRLVLVETDEAVDGEAVPRFLYHD
jgi:hypothetical protein